MEEKARATEGKRAREEWRAVEANEVKDSHNCRGKEWGDKNKEYCEDSTPPLSVQLQCEPYM